MGAEEAGQIIGVDGAEVLVSIIEGAWQAHLAEKRPRRARTRANIVWASA